MDAYEHFRRFAEKHNLHFDYANEYGEPGYSNPEAGILVANWNDVPRGLADCLESAGFELEWQDEWDVSCESCPAKAWRTSPDSYGWTPRVLYCDGYVLTADDDLSDWIEQCEFTASNNGRALPAFWDREAIEDCGWKLHEEGLESGWHPGPTDDPQKIAAELLKTHARVLFQVTQSEQFTTRFCVYVPTDEE